MKLFRWLLTLLLFIGVYLPVQADWVDVTDQFMVIESINTEAPQTIDVTVTNITDDILEGQFRLFYVPDDGAPVPVNALPAGEAGSDPSYYFPIVGMDEGLLEPDFPVHISMTFDVSVPDPLQYSLSVEVNDASVDNAVFRKKISKTPEFYSGEGAIQVMPIYATARNTKGDKYKRSETGELILCGETCDENGENCTTVVCSETEYAEVKPIIVKYIQEEERAPFNSVTDYNGDGNRYAHDVYVAVSLDDGLTWKRRNISRTSLKSSFQLPNGVDYPGDSEDADLVVEGPYALVTWTDKYCRSGDPWGIADSGIEDVYQVTGSQKSVDYLDVHGDEEPRPDLGVRPFSCVWGARGVLDLDEESPDYGTIVWFKAEQLSTGRRDAKRNFNAAIEPIRKNRNKIISDTGGFAVSWQEDPKGLKTGKGRGPGAGMSGACVNHKTDIWYSFLDWADFSVVDEDFVANSDGDSIQDGEGDPMSEYFCTADECEYVYDPEYEGVAFVNLPDSWTCPLCEAGKDTFEKDARPHALYHFNPPVRVTDNAVCRERTSTPIYGHTHIDGVDCDYYYEGGTNNQPLLWEDLPEDWACPKCGGTLDTFNEDVEFIKNRNEGAPYCSRFAGNTRVDGDGNVVAPGDEGYELAYYTTDDGIPLDGNTGASRANLSLVNWDKQTLALMAYEETKGVGAGSDKQTAAMEQAAPYPLVDLADQWIAGAVNSDCRSCHYQNEVPRDRYIPMATPEDCAAKGATWVGEGSQFDGDYPYAYFPYTGYPFETSATVDKNAVEAEGVSTIVPGTDSAERCVPCIKFFGGRDIYPRDYAKTDPTAYYNLPDHMPGWHQAALDCTSCHLPYGTKDSDGDTVKDRADMCSGTPAGETVDLYGCADAQSPDDPDNNKDEPDRFRHGKNVYYHHFPFNAPDPAAIAHGDQINGRSKDIVGQDDKGNDILWTAPGNYDPYENARRVRVVPNAVLNEKDSNGITLGLLYKEGKDGQGSPADAILRLFKGGFSVDKMGLPLNLSSSTPYRFQDPANAGNEDGTGDNPAGDGTGDMLPNRNTPKIDHFYWTEKNLDDPTGYWYKDDSGDNLFDGIDGYSPVLSSNPFENVFSTRLAIYGDTVLAGYAYCVNWSSGKKAKDHYDFYIRMSENSGKDWTLPVNVSRLKNHEESVSDCRVILTPTDLEVWGLDGAGIPFSQTGAAADEMRSGDFNQEGKFFVGVGTKENIPQPSPNVTELEESEVFLDVFYAQAKIEAGAVTFETYTKENPKYDAGSSAFLDMEGYQTSSPCAEKLADDTCVPNKPNPAYPEYVDEFYWLAKGAANQGDVQIVCNPFGNRFYTIWEQELPITDEDGQNHFQGADVWFRKVLYGDPVADMDVNQDGEVTVADGREIKRHIGETAYDQDFLWVGDFFADHRINGKDYDVWKKAYRDLE